MNRPASTDTDADVIVVGAGPAGSATAYHLAGAGLDVLLLEKTEFPREKVCGDGLTPRAVKSAGLDGHRHLGRGRLDPQPGPAHHRRRPPARAAPGPTSPTTRLRPGPHAAPTSTRSWPGTRRRPAPGCTSATAVTGPVLDERTGRVVGVTARTADADGAKRAGGDLPRAAGRRRRRQLVPALAGGRPATAATTGRWAWPSAPTTRAPGTRTTGWSRGSSSGTTPVRSTRLLPGYGWIFGVGDGTSNVGPRDPQHQQGLRERRLQGAAARRWLDHTPEEWGYRRRRT